LLVAVLFLPLLVSCRSPELEIKQGECRGIYRASDFRGMSGEYVFKPQGKGCKDSASLIYETSQSQGVSLEFYGIKYAARSGRWPGLIHGRT